MIGKILRWGNSYGIRLSKRDVEEAGLHEGEEVVVDVKAREGEKVPLDWLRTFSLGEDLSIRHDEYEWA